MARRFDKERPVLSFLLLRNSGIVAYLMATNQEVMGSTPATVGSFLQC